MSNKVDDIHGRDRESACEREGEHALKWEGW